MKKILILICFSLIAISVLGCNKKSVSDTDNGNDIDNGSDTMDKVVMVINNNEYEVNLYDNKTALEFYNLLPFNITMSELNGNEKYYYMNNKLTTNTKKVDNINIGDIKLYGNDCIVLFYDSFKTSYSYTDIGYVLDKSFVSDLSTGSTDIIFKIKD